MDRVKEKLFGISVLQEYFKLTARVDESAGTEWMDVNIQPDRVINIENISVKSLEWRPEELRKKVKICPHYQFLEMMAQILMIDQFDFSQYRHFCGLIESPIMVGDRYGRHFERGGIKKETFTVCHAFDMIIHSYLELATTKLPEDIVLTPNSTLQEIEKGKEKSRQLERYLYGQKILSIWKISLPEAIMVHDSIGNEDLVNKIKNLHTQLKEQIVGNSMFFSEPVCVQAPKVERKQWLYID